MRVRHSKVAEDVAGADLVVEQVQAEGVSRAVVGREGPHDRVAHGERGQLLVVLGAQHVPGVEVELPPEGHDERGHGGEELGLHPDPALEQGAPDLLRDPGVEGDEREGVQIHVMLELLRRGVVLVVLVAPPGARHAAAHAVEHHLERAVRRDVARQRVVAALVHEPAAAALHDAQHQDAGEDPPVVDERGPREVHEHDLGDAPGHVQRRGLEIALGLELIREALKVGHELRAARGVGLVHGARGQGGEHLVRFLGAHVELAVGVGRVGAHLVVDDLPARVALDEARHVVHAVTDDHLFLALARVVVDQRRGRGRVRQRVVPRGHG
mmetsp:Transcript_12830/g.43442  ORF Transcript_12830/g.43442 Transcript_12830/m.43442 type:complete len:326 (+) Transcript_12830:743-1720(+)